MLTDCYFLVRVESDPNDPTETYSEADYTMDGDLSRVPVVLAEHMADDPVIYKVLAESLLQFWYNSDVIGDVEFEELRQRLREGDLADLFDVVTLMQ